MLKILSMWSVVAMLAGPATALAAEVPACDAACCEAGQCGCCEANPCDCQCCEHDE